MHCCWRLALAVGAPRLVRLLRAVERELHSGSRPTPHALLALAVGVERCAAGRPLVLCLCCAASVGLGWSSGAAGRRAQGALPDWRKALPGWRLLVTSVGVRHAADSGACGLVAGG
jgi:hypothetical protein